MTDDEAAISTKEAAVLLGCDPEHVVVLIDTDRLKGWPIYTATGRIHAWRTSRAAIEDYKRTKGRSQLSGARAGKPSWLAAS